MRNDIFIDEEFRDLLPALDSETHALLEENLIQNGCHDPIILWGKTIIDGHNRFMICIERSIPFNTVEMEFPSREHVLIWIISTQVSRRNLSQIQLSYFRGRHYKADRKLVGNTSGKNQYNEELRHNDVIPKVKSTAARIVGTIPCIA